MYENLELQRIALQIKSLENDSERIKSDLRFRCIEIARTFLKNDSADSLLKDAKLILDFVYSE